MSETKPSNYWLDQAAAEIIKRYPEGEIVVSSGISPSASYHIGHFREIMTAEALKWAVSQRGRKVRHVHVVDNFDPLRKRYDFLPESFEQYVGWPVCLVPDPTDDVHSSYADHYYAEFKKFLEPMGIDPEIVLSYQDLYLPNHMTPYIEKALEKINYVRQIFEEQSNRKLPHDWTPVWVKKADNRFEKGDLSTWDKVAKTLNGVSYENGGAKLDWRLDWSARWAYLGVNVEPFGAQEHGASGGSYDTGKLLAKEVYGVDAPYDAARYGHIHRAGENIKMSSSKGNVVTPSQALDIMPAEVLRYFIVRSRPERKLQFDSGTGLINLIDEFAAAQADSKHEFRDAYNFAVEGRPRLIISSVPFKHLVSVYQAARGDVEAALKLLERTDYADEVKREREVIVAEFKFVANWLEKYAPDDVKFAAQEQLPKVSLTSAQETFLNALAKALADHKGEVDGQTMHTLIYAAKDAANLEPKPAFEALYRVILGQASGPKAGWFLASLDRSWLIKRLRRQA